MPSAVITASVEFAVVLLVDGRRKEHLREMGAVIPLGTFDALR